LTVSMNNCLLCGVVCNKHVAESLCCVTIDFIYSSIVSLCYFYAVLVDDKCCLYGCYLFTLQIVGIFMDHLLICLTVKCAKMIIAY